MSTIIDELIVSLGLDARQFDAAQAASLLKAQSAAEALRKAGQEQEKQVNNIDAAFAKATRHAIEFFAILTGARGLKEFAADAMAANAELGRFSANINDTAQNVSAMEMAAERLGGSGSATRASLERISQSLYDLHRNGQMLPQEFSQLAAAAKTNIDPDHGIDRFLTDVAKAANIVSKTDMSRAHFLLGGLAIDDATANAMIKYGAAFGDYLNKLQKYAPTQQTIQRMQDLQSTWVTLQQSATSLATSLFADLEPVLKPVLEEMTAWIDANRQLITKDSVEAIGRLVDYLKGVDWQSVGQGMLQVAQAIGAIVVGTAQLFGLMPQGATAGGPGGGGGAPRLSQINPNQNDYYGRADNSSPGAGSFMFPGEEGFEHAGRQGAVQAAIRAAAINNGINPSMLLRNYQAEGASNYVGDDKSSYGPFQLHYGGLSSKYPGKGLGDEFTKATGLDARDPSTVNDQIAWYAAHVAQHGWGASMGMKALGITGMAGISPNAAATGAQSAGAMMNWARLSTVQNTHKVSTSQSSVAMHVENLNVSAPGAKDMGDITKSSAAAAGRRGLLAWAANTGPA